jgi:hypothetical protein
MFSRPRFHFFLLFLLFCTNLYAQNAKTSVHGTVKDSLSGDVLPYVTITFEGKSAGVRSDINGNFFIESTKSERKIRVSSIGYQTALLNIKPNQNNEVKILLSETNLNLLEISIRPKKYSKKDNPAVDLIEEVFKHKDQNRKEGLDYYSFEKYEKLQFSLNNITDKYRKIWYFRPFRFVFSNCDTNIVTQKIALPLYLRERLLTAYYRKEPNSAKAKLHGERRVGFVDDEKKSDDDLGVDSDGVSDYLNSTFTDVDIYEPKIQLLGTEFVGPLSGIATNMYRFYIIDTVELDGKKYADLFFAPKNKADLAFMGNMLVALDSTYAVMKVEMGVPKDINLNFVADLHIEQTFERVGEGKNQRLMLNYDAVTADLKILKKSKGRSMLTHKTNYYKNYRINEPLPDSLFINTAQIKNDTGKVYRRKEIWWDSLRFVPLNRSEKFINTMVDSIQKVRIFRILEAIGIVASSGYQRIGWFDLGHVGFFFTKNQVEGNRIRIGGRTNARLYKPLVLESFLAYGFRDQRWKYNAKAVYSFSRNVPRKFPQNNISLSYLKDLQIPGLSAFQVAQGNAATSLPTAELDRYLLNSVWELEHRHEYRNGFSFATAALQKKFNAAGSLAFELSDPNPDVKKYANSLNTSELGFYMRYAPNQKFYNGPNTRKRINTKFPIFSTTYKHGFKDILGGEFNFDKLTIAAEKRFFIAPFGISDWILTGGRLWGAVPYPLLEIHPANQSYLNDVYAYNLMNYLEFVSDKYVSLSIQHNFNGLIFNKLPIIKKWRWREAFSFKCLYGGLDAANDPTKTNGIFKFPKDKNGKSITNHLGKEPYIEISAGIGNIFQILRVDYVWRVTYLDVPGAQRGGIRVMLQGQF